MIDGLKVGIEIEGIFNYDLLSNYIDDNGEQIINTDTEGKIKKYDWIIKSDGSLRHSGMFENESCFELINKKPLTVNGLKRQIRILKDLLSNNGKLELSNIIDFNTSCGLHVHFSYKDIRFYDKVLLSTLIKTRKKFIDSIRKSNIKSREEIIKHYNRRYAKPTKRARGTNRFMNIYLEQYSINVVPTIINSNELAERYKEFNFSSESPQRYKGLEWRALNALSIKTWSEFDELINIIFDCVEFLVNSLDKQKETKTEKIEVDIKEQSHKDYIFIEEREIKHDLLIRESCEVLQCVT